MAIADTHQFTAASSSPFSVKSRHKNAHSSEWAWILGLLTRPNVLIALGAGAPRSQRGLVCNPGWHEPKRDPQPSCSRWHTGTASTASSEISRTVLDGCQHRDPTNLYQNRENPGNTGQHRSPGPRRSGIHPQDPASRYRIYEFSRNPVFNLPLGSLPIREANLT